MFDYKFKQKIMYVGLSFVQNEFLNGTHFLNSLLSFF